MRAGYKRPVVDYMTTRFSAMQILASTRGEFACGVREGDARLGGALRVQVGLPTGSGRPDHPLSLRRVEARGGGAALRRE
jgi:hypothetical protein